MKRLCYHYTHFIHYPQTSLIAPYSSSITSTDYQKQKPKWQSKTNVIIKNPTLRKMESCTTMRELKQIQAHMTIKGLIADAFPISRVLAFCALSDSGDLRYARQIFARIENPNTYTWNTMIRGCYMAGKFEMGFEFFARMVRDRVEMDGLSFVYVLKAAPSFSDGESACGLMRKMGFDSDLIVRNGLIRYLAEQGLICDARKVFDESLVRDVVTWTTVIDGFAKVGLWDEALEVFGSMVVEPNEVTMIAVFSACSGKGDPRTAERVFSYAKSKGLNRSLKLVNSALDMFAKCGSMVAAKEIFDAMKTRDVFSWTSMIDGFAKSNDLDSARTFFDETPEKNMISWNAMIAGYSQNNRPIEALELFDEMTTKQGLIPTEHALVCALSSCAQLGRLSFGQSIHRRYINTKLTKPESAILTNALIDMYGKCGSIDESTRLFEAMPNRNIVSWNAMIACYAAHGYADRALTLFDEMKRTSSPVKPDDVTFVAVLSACSHSGRVLEGRECFESMDRDFGVRPKREHYGCLVDLLGRAGLLEEARNVIERMPMEPGESAWGALLSASRVHGDAELAEESARKVLETDPGDSGAYVSLAGALAGNKRWDDVRRVRAIMRDNKVEKNPGLSSVEIRGKFHEFLAGDESHPQTRHIYELLNAFYAFSNSQESEQHYYAYAADFQTLYFL